ncbi:MarR family transcriptional regulator, partial [Microbacterium sp. AGC85]
MAARQHVADRDLVGPSPTTARPAARTTNEDVRQQNLSTVLQLVHGYGALSRSEIGARTGLTRSTVTALVQELLDLKVVCETSVKPPGRAGRP